MRAASWALVSSSIAAMSAQRRSQTSSQPVYPARRRITSPVLRVVIHTCRLRIVVSDGGPTHRPRPTPVTVGGTAGPPGLSPGATGRPVAAIPAWQGSYDGPECVTVRAVRKLSFPSGKARASQAWTVSGCRSCLSAR